MAGKEQSSVALTNEARLLGARKCDTCDITIAEWFVSKEFPQGAYRIIQKHHGQKHESILTLPSVTTR